MSNDHNVPRPAARASGEAATRPAPVPAPAWEREVVVTELSEQDAAVRTWSCKAIDLSRSGITLCSRHMVHQARTLVIRMSDGGARGPRVLYGRVDRSSYEIGRGYMLKVSFCERPRPLAAAAAACAE